MPGQQIREDNKLTSGCCWWQYWSSYHVVSDVTSNGNKLFWHKANTWAGINSIDISRFINACDNDANHLLFQGHLISISQLTPETNMCHRLVVSDCMFTLLRYKENVCMNKSQTQYLTTSYCQLSYGLILKLNVAYND